MDLKQHKKQLKHVIPFDFTGAITQCEAILRSDSDTYNELINIQTQYQEAQQKYRINHIGQAELMQLLSRLTTSFLQLVDNLTEYDLPNDEIEEAGPNSITEILKDGDHFIAVDAIQEIFSSVYDGDWKWFKDRAKEKASFAMAARIYGGEVWREYNSIRVFGMTEETPLDSLFVRVNILEKSQDKYTDSLEFLEKNFDTSTRKVNFGTTRNTKTGIETINSLEKMIVLGKPGAGKSTYLKFLALQSIQEESEIKDRKVPIFVTLKEWAEKKHTLLTHLSVQFSALNLKDTSLLIKSLLDNGKCLLLLDGLDEVEEQRKNDVIQEIIDFSKKYHKNQFVVSCRVAAYNAWFNKFVDVEMADFSDEQIESFIKNWFHVEPELGEKCWGKLKGEAPLKELASTPLLLTLLCIAYHENMNFHASRAELYEEAITALLKRWDTTRRIERDEPYKKLSVPRKRALFSRIATQAFEQGQYFFKKKQIVGQIADYIRNLEDLDIVDLEDTGEGIFEAIVANHGIFIPRAKGIYSFAHLTFQEFFTAKYIVENAVGGSIAILIDDHIEDDKWREVFLLTTSMLGDADQFLRDIHKKAAHYLNKNLKLRAFFENVNKTLLKTSIKQPYNIRKSYAIFLISAIAIIRDVGRNRKWDYRRPAVERVYSITKFLDDSSNREIAITIMRDFKHDYARAFDQSFDLATAYAIDHSHAQILARSLDLDTTLAKDLAAFLGIKLRIVECLGTECYVTHETRQWLMDNLMEHAEEIN